MNALIAQLLALNALQQQAVKDANKAIIYLEILAINVVNIAKNVQEQNNVQLAHLITHGYQLKKNVFTINV